MAAMVFPRITVDPAICTGKPCIRGLRFPVARLLGLLAAGETREAILTNYPYLETEDIDAALRYAAWHKPGVVHMDRKSRFPIRGFDSLDAMKADEYFYWRHRPAHERMTAVAEITAEAYGLRDSPPHASRLQRTLVHLKR